MTPDAAEAIAISALGWIAHNGDLAGVFLGATGASVSDIRERAADPVFLLSVLEFITMDDQWITQFCDENQYSYETPMKARQVLSGPGQEGW